MNRALELDPDLAEAHAALGLVQFYFEWDWAGAEAEFRRALELNPGSRSVHEEYGNFLTAHGPPRRGARAEPEGRRARPAVGRSRPRHRDQLHGPGRLEQAAANFRRTIDIDPNWTWGYIKLARTLARQKKCPEALAQAEIAERRIAGGAAPLSRSWLGATYAHVRGDRARPPEARRAPRPGQKQYVDPVTFADVHGALGETDEALRWYEKAFEDRTPNMVYAPIVPRLDPELAGNPRYEAIVRKMGFTR